VRSRSSALSVSGDVKLQALPVPNGIQVTGGREVLALGREQKAVVAQVVGIGHADVEHNAPPTLRQLLCHVGALLHQQAGQLQVAGPVLVVGAVFLVAQQGQGGGEVLSLAGRSAVEALGEVGVVATVKALGPPGRYPQTGSLGQLINQGFPGTHVALVFIAGKPGNPQLAVFVHHAGLGPAPQRAAGRHQHKTT
jgi:hypothetical protein